MPDLFGLKTLFWSDLTICVKRETSLNWDAYTFKLNLTVVIHYLYIFVKYVAGDTVFYVEFGNFFHLNLNCYNGC